MWPEEAAEIAQAGRPLTALTGIGLSLAKRLQEWIEAPPEIEVPPVRREYLTLAQARRVLKKNPQWQLWLKGDLQMHTEWSDGSGSISEMAAAAIERGKLDLVLGCFQSALRRTEDQTSRYVAGLRDPDIQILGHPQTRVWNRCEDLQADWSIVFAEAALLDKQWRSTATRIAKTCALAC